MNVVRLRPEIRIDRANNNPGMPGVFLVQSYEVFPVESDQRAVQRNGVFEYILIRNLLIGAPGLV
jgi:hypothetical protein